MKIDIGDNLKDVLIETAPLTFLAFMLVMLTFISLMEAK